jgi:hypothetical protein
MGSDKVVDYLFRGLMFFVALWAAWSAHKNSRRSDASAESAKNSSKVAVAALELERERFEKEKADSEKRKIDEIVESGIQWFRKDGNTHGAARWLRQYPELCRRSDFHEILRRVLGASGNDPNDPEGFLNWLVQEKHLPPDWKETAVR